MQCVVAVLLYGLGKQVLGRGEHLDMPWAALALVFCCLIPANLADKYIIHAYLYLHSLVF
jgi:uncharacterized membrane protein